MKRIIQLLSLALIAFTSMACSAQNKQQQEEQTADTQASVQTGGKALVVFFSHAGENYAVGDVPVGNTKIVADYISAFIGADQFEVVCEKDYNMAYKPLCDLAKKEQEDGELPAFKGQIDNLDDYATIFVGSPVWWGTYPQVMFTFFKAYDLNSKTLIPFTTHEGSGLGRCVEDLKAAYPAANVTGAYSIAGHDVRKGQASVEKWLTGLGFSHQ